MQQVISSKNIHLVNERAYNHQGWLITNFFEWCDRQEEKRFMWLSIALMVGIGTILPLTLFAIMVGANSNFTLWIITSAVNVPILVLILAVQPMKATLSVLFLAWTTDVIIMAYCTVLFFANL
jgi:hypothetical protein